MIETEHRGYKISYSDNAQAWFCSDLSLEAPQLPALRDKINQHLSKLARMNVKAFYMSPGYDAAIHEATVTSIASDLDYRKRPQCWISLDDGGKTRRTKVAVEDLIPTNDDARAAIAAFQACEAAVKRAEKAAGAAHDAIPRLSLKDLQAQKVEAESDGN